MKIYWFPMFRNFSQFLFSVQSLFYIVYLDAKLKFCRNNEHNDCIIYINILHKIIASVYRNVLLFPIEFNK